MRLTFALSFVLTLVATGAWAHDNPPQAQDRPRQVEPPAAPMAPSQAEASAALGGVPDVAFCELYGLQQFGRVGSVVGLALSTTSWNVGSRDLMWLEVPDSRHPFIVQNLYRLKNDRFEQIGQSWVKHGFYALGDEQCGTPCTFDSGHSEGDWLGQGCTDTYSSFLNADQGDLGPRQEINPWTASWSPTGSHTSTGHSHNNIAHRLQVNDADLNPATNAGATYYAEGYYVHFEDTNVLNSAAYKQITVSGSPGGTWTFGMSGPSTKPKTGFAINAWTGVTKTTIAQEVPVDELTSPDGRCLLSAKVTDLGTGNWHYEYALLNVDMSRKVKSFSIPILPGADPVNIGFSAVLSHNESYSNTPWTSVVTNDCPVGERCVTWSTTDNPLRWGTLYNFRFDIDSPPAGGMVASGEPLGAVGVGLFEAGTPSMLTAATVGPEFNAPIPATSAWAITSLALLVASVGTVMVGRRPRRPGFSTC